MGVVASKPTVPVGINDLPDELILIIWRKLHQVDLLHAFVGVNRRFDRIVRDSLFTHSVQVTSQYFAANPLDVPTLDRYCLEILPRISQQIKCLIVEGTTAERVLLSSHYPQLHKLVFTRMTDEFIACHLNDQSTLWNNKLKFQITHLVIKARNDDSLDDILPRLLVTFPQLSDLEFNSDKFFFGTRLFIRDTPPWICQSSSLVNLNIRAKTSDDCLRLFDGRFPQLTQVRILMDEMIGSTLSIDNLKSLSNMRSFSLTAPYGTTDYDSHLLPLIQQMTGLEELCLFIDPVERRSFIDGIHLKRELLAYLPQLRTFTMNLITCCHSMNDAEYRQSTDELRQAFADWPHGRITGYISHYRDNKARCHVYSLPGSRTFCYMISCGFSANPCVHIRHVQLNEHVYPLSHALLLRIARAFPCLTHLAVHAYIPSVESAEVNGEKVTIADFPHLIHLTLQSPFCPAYLEQFLLDTHTYLPKLTYLETSYQNLVAATNNFTREATRRNCSKVQTLWSDAPTIIDLPPQFFSHFPSLR